MMLCTGKYQAPEQINKVLVCVVLSVLLRFKNRNKAFRKLNCFLNKQLLNKEFLKPYFPTLTLVEIINIKIKPYYLIPEC